MAYSIDERCPMADTTHEMPRHVEIAYKEAADNIIFYKRQQWMATNYAILVYALILVLSARFFSRTDMARGLLGVLTALTFLYHLYTLKLLQDAVAALRLRLEWIYRTYFTADERSGLNFPFESRPSSVDLLGLVAVSVIGAGLTLIYLFSVRN
jgi:hypothetical protein